MKYTEEFKKTVDRLLNSKEYVGTGNPNSKILIIGKETATDVENKANKNEDYVRFQKEALEDFNLNAEKWNNNIKNQIKIDDLSNWKGGIDSPIHSNPIFPFKSLHPKDLKEGHTWRKYQKLHDYIFLRDISRTKEKVFDFHNNFFLTEMNNDPAKFTKDANKSSIFGRKLIFKENSFYQNFQIVILACSNYITGHEIEDIFNVKFEEQCGQNKQLFWTHYNENRTKLVIHTRQLSTNVSDALLKEMSEKILEILK